MNPTEPSSDLANPKSNHRAKVCPRTGRLLKPVPRLRWWAWAFSGMGLVSLLWFLVRVIPKPSRAAYPCQRLAFPLASSFVVWLTALLGSAFAWRKAQARGQRFWKACLWGAGALACWALVVRSVPTWRCFADNPPHGPLGVAKGVCPGRVAWVYAPGATSWDGYTSPEHWFETNHCDLATVEVMLSKAIQSVGGTNSNAAAWDAMFKYYNQNQGKGGRGYQAGEKVAIKINLTTCNARSGSSTVDINGTYEKQDSYDGHWLNSIDASPQLLLSLLRHLVYVVGVNQTNISMGDPTGNFPKYLWDRLHPEFPNVIYFDNYGQQGRTRVELSAVPFYWSVTNAVTPGQPVAQDYVPVPFAQADYLINVAVPKSHALGGITSCGKNFYGALLRCPDGYFRDANGTNQWGNRNYSSMHTALPGSTPGLGNYRALVDLMGSPNLGGKTLLCLGDALFSGQDWAAKPYKWNMAPFNGNWPSSIFASQDPVAFDSVCYDFLSTEWPTVVNASGMGNAAEDYLHEAALADSPPSGTFYDPGKTGNRLASLGVHEHWNNATDKKYSRNLDPANGTGIELVALTATRPDAMIAISQPQGQPVLSWLASLGYGLETTTNLAVSNAWTTVTPLPPAFQGLNWYTNSASEPSRFYRLSKPLPPPQGNAPTYGNNKYPWTISATNTTRIEAENYDTGGEGAAYHDTTSGNSGGAYRSDDVDIEACSDTGAGYDLGWTATGEWLTYTIDVASAGTYSLKLRAAGSGGGTIRVWFGALNKTGTLTIPNTGGWQTWTDVIKTAISLSAGQQVMKVEMLSGGYNLNWIELTRTGP